jgi:hypothetical protein
MSRSSADDLFALLGRLAPEGKGEGDDIDLSPPVSPIRRASASPAPYAGAPSPSSLAHSPSSHPLPTATGQSAPPLSRRLRPTTAITEDLRSRSGLSASGSSKRLSGASDEPVPVPSGDVLSLFSILTRDLEREESTLAGSSGAPFATPVPSSGSGKHPRDVIDEMLAAPLPLPAAFVPPSPQPQQEPIQPDSPLAFRGWASQPPLPPPLPPEVDSEPAPDPFAVFQRELLVRRKFQSFA